MSNGGRIPLPIIAETRQRDIGGNRANINWHDEDLHKFLMQEHAKGSSATEIMHAIHDAFIVPHHAALTRNAVLGALHRKGVKATDRRFRKPNPDRKPRGPRSIGGGGSRAQRLIASKAAAEKAAANSARAKVMEQGKEGAEEVLALYGKLEPWERMSIPFRPNGRKTIPLVDLNEDTCRWPFECDSPEGEEGRHTFCGDRVIEGTGFPYCPMHARLASGGMPPPRKAPQYPLPHRQTR